MGTGGDEKESRETSYRRKTDDKREKELVQDPAARQ